MPKSKTAVAEPTIFAFVNGVGMVEVPLSQVAYDYTIFPDHGEAEIARGRFTRMQEDGTSELVPFVIGVEPGMYLLSHFVNP